MGNTQQRPILITGGGRRIGLALAHHFLNLHQPVIVSYRNEYPSIEGLRKAGAVCIQADFSTDEGILAFAEKVKSTTSGLRALIHNASAWLAENPARHSAIRSPACCKSTSTPLTCLTTLLDLLRGHGHAAATLSTSPITWWSAAATSISPTRPVKRRWIT
jgi:dihydromonapterin reductase/dihydrofolate reductase